MINYIITGFFLVSFLLSAIKGNASDLSQSLLFSSENAVKLVIGLSGSMALWGGIMQVANKSGITKAITKALKKPVGFLFPALPEDSEAFQTICMNITANLLGLGNAATPLGIKAIKQLKMYKYTYSYIPMLVVLNTSSIQLIPITVATLRLNHGSQSPWDCTLPILVVSLISVIAGCLAVSVLYSNRSKNR
ncbi:MAG: hypothetical protein IJU04_04220 [Ruminococcus sp.]|nr:hypothetical protein [Ruminococcus sp.]